MVYDPDWQAKTISRLEALGYAGFIYGPGTNWWPIDKRSKRVAGPFTSTDDFSAWLTEQETRPRS